MRRPGRGHIVLPQRWHLFFQRAGKIRALKMLLVTAIVAAVVLTVVIAAENHLRPMIAQLARVRVDYLATSAVNDAIMDKITSANVDYGSLVHFEKDIYGNITALKTDIVSVNRLKADIMSDVLERLEHIGTSELAIPLGNVINGELFSGRGPKIPVRIVPLGTVTAGFSNVFTAAGINQTRHQIIMDVEVEISVLLPGYAESVTVKTQVNIAETVIVGAVPESYTHFEEAGDIFSRAEPYKSIVP